MISTNNYVNPADFDRILNEIPRLMIRKWPDHDIKFLFKICYECALRMGEAVKLRKESFDLERRDVFLGTTKTRLNDKTVIPKKFIPELTIYLNYKDTGRLFPGLTRKRVNVWIIKLGEWLDIEAWVTPQSETGEKTKGHIFRKSRGKDLENEGVNLSIIKDLYRHDSLNTTSQYLRNSTEAVKKVI